VGELSERVPIDSWRAMARITPVNGAADYLPRWPDLICPNTGGVVNPKVER
jgi:hypothetical protein